MDEFIDDVEIYFVNLNITLNKDEKVCYTVMTFLLKIFSLPIFCVFQLVLSLRNFALSRFVLLWYFFLVNLVSMAQKYPAFYYLDNFELS